MLSDEEREAIEKIKRFNQYNWEMNNLKGKEFAKPYFESLDTLLNLIEKQSKEIEELKIQNNKLAQCHFKYEEMTGVDLLLPDKLEYTSNDKIKAKIEELKDGTYDAKIVLQSLLEKE